MRNLFYILAACTVVGTSCQSAQNDNNQSTQTLMEEAIRVHDEIMPQISTFDRTTVKIDSILENLSGVIKTNPSADTALIRTDLSILKNNLEAATDNMMTWMHEYAPDSTDIAYQQAEIEKIKAMKKQFEDVSLESNKKLGSL